MIIISPYSRNCIPDENTKEGSSLASPKNYPYWTSIIKALKEKGFTNIVQIGLEGETKLEGVDDVKFNLPLKEVEELVSQCRIWLSVDNFLPHLANAVGKKGVVIFTITNPDVFGYRQNRNLLKDKKFIREGFLRFRQEEVQTKSYVSPREVVEAVLSLISEETKVTMTQ